MTRSRLFRASSVSFVFAALTMACSSNDAATGSSSGDPDAATEPDAATGADSAPGATGPTTDAGASNDGSSGELTAAQRTAAATSTAEKNANCTAVQPFYWEVGDKSTALASGSVGASPPVATTVMAIASSSKWIFGAYAVEKMGGMPIAVDIPLFNFTSGYAGFTSDSCPAAGTIDDCLAGASGMQVATSIGKFDYNGAHLQKLASVMGLGALDNAGLATEVKSQIGTEIDVKYSQPQPAGGIYTSATQYALFLRKLLIGSAAPLMIGSLLDADSVCTNPTTCTTAVYSPIPGTTASTESWHYGLAHWIEDDPKVGDGAYSSAGAFGFYPWVDKSRTLYGVLARRGNPGHAGYDSALCGRLIRKAWVTGVAQ